MLIINQSLPIYFNNSKKVIRMGNFKETGKEIIYEDDSILSIFNNVTSPISLEDLISVVHSETSVNKEEVLNAINYLIDEKFIINKEDYDKLIEDDKFCRQEIYFDMCGNNTKLLNSILKSKRILILGLGGIGSNAAVVLNRMGFNNFTLVDYDKVEESNLIRQFPYNYEDIGKLKTDCLKEKLIVSNVKILNAKIENDVIIREEIKKTDFVLCTIDTPIRVVRRLINKICIEEKKPVLFSGFSEHVAMVGPFVVPGKTACLSCIEKNLKDVPLGNVKIVPSYGPLCLFISSLVSNEIINYFLGNECLKGKTLMYNMISYETNIIKWRRKNKCQVCGLNDSK